MKRLSIHNLLILCFNQIPVLNSLSIGVEILLLSSELRCERRSKVVAWQSLSMFRKCRSLAIRSGVAAVSDYELGCVLVIKSEEEVESSERLGCVLVPLEGNTILV
ncbi:hypothetical protein M5689_005343 [Euphorbia peplus]|nr:hypothetical protein M5689_005343 [Euphorbia peplus]